jgi:tRNA (guanine37-N1)-methyltransferase
MNIDIISIFPDLFKTQQVGVCKRAFEQNEITTKVWNPRNYATEPHRNVDDRPFGGGPGMVMSYPPLSGALEDINAQYPHTHTIYLSPQGKPLTQAVVKELAILPQITLISGRYAGIDQRIIDQYVDQEISIGDYIVSGGELPILVLIDAIARLLPGTLSNNESADADSFNDGLLAGPYYTRPATINNKKTPEILTSGDHAAIKQWKKKESLRKTWQTRPDLLKRHLLDKESLQMLEEIKKG